MYSSWCVGEQRNKRVWVRSLYPGLGWRVLQLARVLKVSLGPGVWRKGGIKVCKWSLVARAADVQLAFGGPRGDFLSSS